MSKNNSNLFIKKVMEVNGDIKPNEEVNTDNYKNYEIEVEDENILENIDSGLKIKLEETLKEKNIETGENNMKLIAGIYNTLKEIKNRA